jgi:non-heme chloroperoxidase
MENTYNNYLTTEDNQKIFYQTNFPLKGSETHQDVLVFLYGLVCSHHHYREQIQYFDRLGFKILLHDYRGHYQSTYSQVEELTFKNFAKDLNQLLMIANIKSTHLIGHSMGVNVALEFYRSYPQAVKSLCIVSGTVMPVDSVMLDSNFIDLIRPMATKILKKYPDSVKTIWKYTGWNPIIKKIIHKEGFNVSQVSDEFIEIYLNRIGQLGPDIFFQLMEQLNVHDIMTIFPNTECPTLIIGGDKDKVIPNYLQQLTHKHMPNSEIYIIKNGSHVPQVDFPEMFNERVRLFLHHVMNSEHYSIQEEA